LATSNTVYLLDASIYVFRAWFGYPDSIADARGRPVNAAFGYWRQLVAQMAAIRPRYMLAAFDESLFSGFRHQLYPPYKANRALPDESLAYQLDLCRLLTEQLGICCRSSPRYEADDLLATGAAAARQQGVPFIVISRDKDLAQLVGPGDGWWDWSTPTVHQHSDLCTRWGIDPSQIPDLLALAGDAVDNIPGVRSLGIKTATCLISHFGDLETLYADLDAVATLPLRGSVRLRAALAAEQDNAFLFRDLIRLRQTDEPVTLQQMQVQPPDPAQLHQLLDQLGLGKGFRSVLRQHFG
jgi:5'-3' exonuclease